MKLRTTVVLLATTTILGGCAHPLDGLTSYRDGPLPTGPEVMALVDTQTVIDGEAGPGERSRRGGVDPQASLRGAQRDMARWATETGFGSNVQIAGDATPIENDPGAVQRHRKIASHAAPVADLRPVDTGVD